MQPTADKGSPSPGEGYDPERFRFLGLHPAVFLGTASDRYAGWIGQVYSAERFGGKVRSRRKTLGGKTFVEKVLPVESVEEYFQHFPILELDFTFYRLLLDPEGAPTQNFHVLRSYRHHMDPRGGLILKVPQVITARRLMRGGRFVPNPDYLDPETFTRRFYEPAVELLGDALRAFVFEQEYQRREERVPPHRTAEQLDRFFDALPRDDRYHLELRTEALLCPPVFAVAERHGVGQVLSHWTWLPSLQRQFRLAGGRFLNAGGDVVVRLLTPAGMRYEEAYAKAHPFDRLVEGMTSSRMIRETADLMWEAVRRGRRIHVIVNNRAGGNAPLIARMIADRFLGRPGGRWPNADPSPPGAGTPQGDREEKEAAARAVPASQAGEEPSRKP